MTKRGKLQLILAGSAGQSSLVPPSQVKIQSCSADYGWNQCHPLAVYQSTCKLSRWDLSPVPPGQGLLSPKYTDRSEKNGALGGVLTVHCGRGWDLDITVLVNSAAKTSGPATTPSYFITSVGSIHVTQAQSAPSCTPSPFHWHGLQAEHHTRTFECPAQDMRSYRAQVAVLHHGDSHPAPIYRSAALSVSRSNDTHTNTVIPSWALMWLEVMAGNKSLLLVPGWIACRWVNPIANPNNMTSSLLQKQFLCNVPYSNGSASSRSE